MSDNTVFLDAMSTAINRSKNKRLKVLLLIFDFVYKGLLF